MVETVNLEKGGLLNRLMMMGSEVPSIGTSIRDS